MDNILNNLLGDFLQQRVLWLMAAWVVACVIFLKLLVPYAAQYVSVNPFVGLVALSVYFAVVIKRTIKRNPSPFEA